MATVFNRIGGGSGGETASIFAYTDNSQSTDTCYATKGSKRKDGVYGSKSSYAYKYIKLNITKRKAIGDALLQFSRLEFINSNNNTFAWDVESITTTLAAISTSESVDNILDGSVDTKYCTTEWGSSQTGSCDIVIKLNDAIDISTYNRYQYYTANDCNNRDPISWNLYVSNDGTTWVQIDTRSDQTITNTRKTLAGTWSVTQTPTLIYGFNINDIDEYGTWVVTYSNGTKSAIQNVLIDGAEEYAVQMNMRLYLYNLGYTCDTVTGGWISQNLRYTTSTPAATVSLTKNESNMQVYLSTQGGGIIKTANAIDVTNYNSIHFAGTIQRGSDNDSDYYQRLCVWDSTQNAWGSDISADLFLGASNTTVEVDDIYVDVSSVSGEKIIGVGIYHGGANPIIIVKKIWLE